MSFFKSSVVNYIIEGSCQEISIEAMIALGLGAVYGYISITIMILDIAWSCIIYRDLKWFSFSPGFNHFKSYTLKKRNPTK